MEESMAWVRTGGGQKVLALFRSMAKDQDLPFSSVPPSCAGQRWVHCLQWDWSQNSCSTWEKAPCWLASLLFGSSSFFPSSLPLWRSGGSSCVAWDGCVFSKGPRLRRSADLPRVCSWGVVEVTRSCPECAKEWHSLRPVTGALLSEQVWQQPSRLPHRILCSCVLRARMSPSPAGFWAPCPKGMM